MWIQVRTIDGSRTETIEDLSRLTKIESLRQKIQESFRVGPDRQRLFYRGKQVRRRRVGASDPPSLRWRGWGAGREGASPGHAGVLLPFPSVPLQAVRHRGAPPLARSLPLPFPQPSDLLPHQVARAGCFSSPGSTSGGSRVSLPRLLAHPGKWPPSGREAEP